MTFLLDANALLALGFLEHEFHARVTSWLMAQKAVTFATCPLTELAFIRILPQLPKYDFTVAHAGRILARLKNTSSLHHRFLPDTIDVSHLPTWARTPRQTTDGYLLALSRAHQVALATLDRGIPGAFVIP